MKIIFLFATISVWCTANAGYSSTNPTYYYPQQSYDHHVPVIHNGVPVETPEVQAAKAAHFEAYAKAQALAAQQPSNGQYEEYPQHYTQAIYQQPSYINNGNHQQYNNYIPQDTPEVQQAKAAHYAAVARAQSATPHYRHRRSLYQHIPLIGKNGVPEETPEVQQAKLQHYIAHATAQSQHYDDGNDNSLALYDNTPYHHHDNGYYHIPVITARGVPEETPEVKAARRQHLLAHYYAKSGTTNLRGGYSDHIPVIGPHGVPFDTAEVQIAKAQHLAAHAEETAKHNQWALHSGYGYGHY